MPFQDLHVFGPALVQIDLNGGTTFADFGYTVEGVTWQVAPTYEPVITDRAGPVMPEDKQYMGALITINLPMAIFDKTIMQSLEKFHRAASRGTIAPADIGTLMFRGLGFFSMKLTPTNRLNQGQTNFPTQDAEVFPVCNLIGDLPRNRSTRVTRQNLTVESWRHPTTGVLWS